MQSGNIPVYLSNDNMFIVQEPLYVTFVVTFGIEGNCALDELIVNASIDEIIGMCVYTSYMQLFINSFLYLFICFCSI